MAIEFHAHNVEFFIFHLLQGKIWKVFYTLIEILIFFMIDEFKIPLLKINGFDRSHQTYDNGAPEN